MFAKSNGKNCAKGIPLLPAPQSASAPGRPGGPAEGLRDTKAQTREAYPGIERLSQEGLGLVCGCAIDQGDGLKYAKAERLEGGGVLIFAESASKKAVCPRCGAASEKGHGSHWHTFEAEPHNGRPVYVKVRVKSYKCGNPDCRPTFTETLEIGGKHQRLSNNLEARLLSLAFRTSDMETARILAQEGAEVSRCQARYRMREKTEASVKGDFSVVGMDDAAIFTGRKYVTVFYTPDGRMIEMVEGRDGSAAAPVLVRFGPVTVLRDRASALALAAALGVPEAAQVADRFHLCRNLSRAAMEYCKKEIPKKGVYLKGNEVLKERPRGESVPKTEISEEALAKMDYDGGAPLDGEGREIEVRREKAPTQSGEAKFRLALKARELAEKGVPVAEIAAGLGVCCSTARGYVEMDGAELEGLKFGNRRSARIQAVDNAVHKALRDGHSGAEALAYALRMEENRSSAAALAARIGKIAEIYFPGLTGCRKGDLVVDRLPEGVARVSRRGLLYSAVTVDPDKISPEIANAWPALAKEFPRLALACDRFHEARGALFGGDPEKLKEFIKKRRGDEVLGSFCGGVEKDYSAVENCVLGLGDSGFVEGLNNKHKLLKRILYGRAGFVNLRKRSLLYFADYGSLDFHEIARTHRVEIVCGAGSGRKDQAKQTA